MKVRREHPNITDGDEQQAVDELRTLLVQRAGDGSSSPPDGYWPNLIVRTNRRIDEATSGKAISISWAARVAIPGVIAILSFFIGLHYYYVPDRPGRESSLTAVVLSASDSAIDSLVNERLRVEEIVKLAAAQGGLLEPSEEQLAEYFLANGKADDVLDAMTFEQVNDVLATLGGHKDAI